MDILFYKRWKLLLWSLFSAPLALGVLLIESMVWRTVGVLIAVYAARTLLRAVTNLVALRCEEDGLRVNAFWSSKIPWPDFNGVDVQKTTVYALGFIPFSHSYSLIIKSNGFLSKKIALPLAQLDAKLEDLPAAIAAIGRYAATRTAGPAAAPASAPQPPAQGRPGAEFPTRERGWDARAVDAIARATGRQRAGASDLARSLPGAAPPVFGKRR
ncbi:MAG: hypothetical protein KGL46_09585 [Hyphomicrobiales bacterium]|nr:hypothetical protein [Hyphomicrobiales bacterium]